MAKRRNPKSKKVAALVEVDLAPSVEAPTQAEPAVATEDQAPIEAVSELPAIAEAPTLAEPAAAAAEPLDIAPAPATAAVDETADVEPAPARTESVVIAAPAPAIDDPASVQLAAEAANPVAEAPLAETPPPAAATILPTARNRQFFARAASIAIAAALGAVVGSLAPLALAPAAAPAVADIAQPDVPRATAASVDKLAIEVATLKSALAGNATRALAPTGATAASVDALARDVAVLKASFGASQTSADAHLTELVAQVNRAERAEADLAARLARFEKPDVTKADVSPEVTGSVQPAAPAIAKGWVLWRVYNGRALVQGRGGYFDVMPGADLPDLGVVREITQRDGRWVVITQNGMIVAAAPGHPLG